jgi:hypothetical protein
VNRVLLACLALLLQLNEHARVLRRVGEDESYIRPFESVSGLFALVGAVYIRFGEPCFPLAILSEIYVAIIGWDELITWLDPLFSPWIMAAYIACASANPPPTTRYSPEG